MCKFFSNFYSPYSLVPNPSGTFRMTLVGEMNKPRNINTVSVVSFEDYEKLSVPESNTTPFIYGEKLVSLMRKQMYKILLL